MCWHRIDRFRSFPHLKYFGLLWLWMFIWLGVNFIKFINEKYMYFSIDTKFKMWTFSPAISTTTETLSIKHCNLLRLGQNIIEQSLLWVPGECSSSISDLADGGYCHSSQGGCVSQCLWHCYIYANVLRRGWGPSP